MSDTLTLKTPVLIDGEEVRELSYDIDKIGVEQFTEAETRSSVKSVVNGSLALTTVEIDYSFHVYLGIMAVVADNPGYTVEDIERVKGPDLMKLMRIGRHFTTAGAGEDGESEDESAPEETDDRDGEDEPSEESYPLALA